MTTPEEQTVDDSRKDLAAQLRELADFVEAGAVPGVLVSAVGLINGSFLLVTNDCSADNGNLLLHNTLLRVGELSLALRDPAFETFPELLDPKGEA